MTQRRLHPVSTLLAFLLSSVLVVQPLYAQTQFGVPASGFNGQTTSSGQGFSGGAEAPVASQPSQGALGPAALSAPVDAGLPQLPVIRQTGQSQSGQIDDKGPTGADMRTHQEPRLKPLPPNDFQRFVLENTGQSLPLYGSDFFSSESSFSAAYGPVQQANAPVSPDYRIGPGDELQIRGWGSVDIDVRSSVDRTGQIYIPRVGAIGVSGLKSSQVEDVVKAAISKYYRDFQLSVTLGRLKGVTVYMVGQARKPGAFNVSSASTLISALFASGGPNQNGSMRHIQVKRGDKVVTELDLYAFVSKGDKSADIRLQDGDTILIPPAKGYVALSGKVSTPAVYELLDGDETLGAMLTLAGGLPVVADPKRAQLERVDPGSKPPRSVEVFALDQQGLQKKLRNGDMLLVASLLPEFNNAVTLRGNVSQPLRMPWKEGLRIRDLIPSKSVLMSRASVRRQNEVLLSDEEKARADSGVFTPENDPQQLANAPRERIGDSADSLARRIGNLVDEVNLDYAVVERVDPNNLTVTLLPFNLGNALTNPESTDNLLLQPGDIVTIFSVNDVRVPHSKRHVYVRVEGEIRRPGIYQMAAGEGLPQLLEKAGGLTPDAYLFGAAFYRDEVRRAQLENLNQLIRRLEMQTQTKLSESAANVSTGADAAGTAQLRLQAEAQAQKQALERLKNLNPSGRIMLGLDPDKVSGEALPNLRLENQDRLVIPSRPDFIYVLGAVNTESALIWQRGRTVQQYLELSGLTGGADMGEIFVIRADGSVVSDHGSWFSHVTRAPAQPGDVIVLPEKTDHESAWSIFTRNAKDITQIIYQFSLGAAAIRTLRN